MSMRPWSFDAAMLNPHSAGLNFVVPVTLASMPGIPDGKRYTQRELILDRDLRGDHMKRIIRTRRQEEGRRPDMGGPGIKWSAEDEQIIWRQRNSGASFGYIASLLNRSASAVEQRWHRLLRRERAK